MNPLSSHWLRVSALLLLATPIIAFATAVTSDVEFGFAAYFTLYIWAGVCVILALVAFTRLVVSLAGRGIRALRR